MVVIGWGLTPTRTLYSTELLGNLPTPSTYQAREPTFQSFSSRKDNMDERIERSDDTSIQRMLRE